MRKIKAPVALQSRFYHTYQHRTTKCLSCSCGAEDILGAWCIVHLVQLC